MVWLTIVTVVKDDLEGFLRSRDSLLRQDLDGVQWVIIDSSVDRREISSVISPMEASVLVEWQEPRGIYPAMNTGLALAEGEFVYFLNAGDEFAADNVVATARRCLTGASWGFGSVRVVSADGGEVVTPSWDYQREKQRAFSRGLFPPHQGTFAATDLVRRCGGFDESYAIVADYALFLRMSQQADPVHIPGVIATFYEGGVSTKQWQESFREFHRARQEILQLRGARAVLERWETLRHYGLVFAHREIRPRLQLLAPR